MYVNRADRGVPHEDIVNTDTPLLVTAVGHYRLQTVPSAHTDRPEGRGDYQLIYIAAGCGHFVFDGQAQTLPQGTAVLYRPDTAQDYTFCASDQAEYFWCHFTGGQVEQLMTDCRIPGDTMAFSVGTSSDFQWLFLQMIRELQTKQEGYDTILCMNLQHILLLIGRYQKKDREASGKIMGEIESAIHFFDMCYSWKIDINEYAKQHLMTPYWFSQNFKKIAKTTPKQYLITLRMANAMNLLDNTDDTVAQVAAAVGYENTQYFHRLFLKYTGMTPTEYRKRIK